MSDPRIEEYRQECERLREELRLATDRIDALLEGGPISLWTQDKELRITWAHNPLSRKEARLLIGLTDADYFEDPEELDGFRKIKQTVMQTGTPARVTVARTVGGQKRFFDLLLKATRDVHGVINGLSGVSYEVTERQQAEQALRQADRRKDEFVALLAHELRGPLAPMRNLLAVLVQRGAEADVRELARGLDRQVGYMTRMIEDLLDQSRIDNDKMVLRRGRFDLALLVQRLSDPIRYKTLSEALPLVQCDVPSHPVMVFADLPRLGQVIGNLLENARKFTPETGQVRIRLEARQTDAWITVEDTGRGIRAEELEAIFERFGQGSASQDNALNGLGLGLYLSRRLIEMHGGTLRAASPGLGQGSTFTAHLPGCVLDEQSLASADAAASDRGRTAPGAKTGAADSPSPGVCRRVLVVDDHEDTAQSMALLINSWGHEVQVVHDGRAGLARVLEWHPDVVFLDVRMPVMDGLEMTRRIRAQADLRQPTLVALTGFGQKGDIELSRAAGVDNHLVKPADPARLKSLIEAGART